MNRDNERLRIGTELAERRKQMGKTQADLTDATGVQRNHISRIEQGRYSVGFDTLQAIADALDADIRIVPRQ
jgi:transcriptional regulator with XRE-family HTH domain